MVLYEPRIYYGNAVTNHFSGLTCLEAITSTSPSCFMADCRPMTRRRTFLLGTTIVLTVAPAALGTASASARTGRSRPVSDRALALHRSESRWHLQQMDHHRVVFARLNRSVHHRFPLAGPFADRAVAGTHMIHGAMSWADLAFLRFHEDSAER